jgi:tetratricopeptide (TPR) repeat protein
MVDEVLGIEAAPIQEIEELPETFEPEAGLRQEEVPSSIEQELPPDLPSWLADVDKTELSQEEEGWLPPEETHLEAGVAPGPDIESLLSKESIEPVEAEGEQLDVNKAGLADLERLPGVGYIRAMSVLAHLQEYGPLSNLDELVNVPGFDSSLVDSLRSQLTAGEVLPVEQIPEGMDIHQMALIQARNALAQGESNQALAHYVSLIKSKQLLPDVIQDLNEALYRFPVDISIWEALGDAHMRSGRLQDALDAYTKAEELIR